VLENITEDGIGQRVQRARRFRGMSLEVLAGRSGKSKSWLSMVENGTRTLDKRRDIAAIADALEVDAADLVGHSVPVFSRGAPDVSGIREALTENSITEAGETPLRPLAAIAADDLPALTAAWAEGDHARQAVMLGPMLADLHAYAAGGRGRTRALEMLTRVSVFASDLAKELGAEDLAWIAADRARTAAAAHGGPETAGMAAWAMALARPVVARSRGLMSAGKAADELEHCQDAGPVAAQVYGMLRLTAALGAHLSGDRDASEAQLAEAVAVAGRTGETARPWEAFGPANAGVWAVTLAVEAGEPGLALDRAANVNPSDLVSAGRVAALHLEKARALSMIGRTAQAIAELRTGEKACPLRIRCDTLARDLVGTMLERSRKEAGGRELRGLAWRMGVIGEA
jgi:transcriptional regulator with XRE-family HTH domain